MISLPSLSAALACALFGLSVALLSGVKWSYWTEKTKSSVVTRSQLAAYLQVIIKVIRRLFQSPKDSLSQKWRRVNKYVRVTLEQMPDEDAQTLAVIVAFAFVYGVLLAVYG